MISKLNSINIYRTLHKAAKYSKGTLTRIEYLLGHRPNLTKFQNFEFRVRSLTTEFINQELN